MADYYQYRFEMNPPDPWVDVFIQDLGDMGFESFERDDDAVLAYIDMELMNESALALAIDSYKERTEINMSREIIEKRNWNEEWESNYHPVRLDDRVLVRAHFHPSEGGVKYQIVITPKMSFGTGHHATTKMMMSFMFDIDFTGKSTFDVGSGTGVLAILAEMMGSKEILAIDIDEWAVENARENVGINHCQYIAVEKAEIGDVERKMYNVILANINLNVILKDLRLYSEFLSSGGDLFLSGFLKSEADTIANEAEKHGLKEEGRETMGEWASLHLIKKA